MLGRYKIIAAGIIGGALLWMAMNRRELLGSDTLAASDDYDGFSILRVGFEGLGMSLKLDKSFNSANWNNGAAVDDSVRFNANVKAFFRVIRECESSQSNDAYFMLNGGELHKKSKGFDADLIDIPHPGIKGRNGTSTAAGAYQCVIGTWQHMSQMRGLGLNAQMSPVNQERVALALCAWRGALPAIIAGDMEAAYAKLGNEWEGLPTGGKPTKTRAALRDVFLKYGGTLARA